MQALTTGPADFTIPLATYRDWLATIPAAARDALIAAHGAARRPTPPATATPSASAPSADGNLTIALQPPRDATPDRKARYHDPDAPPGHGYLAFYLALREVAGIDALIHLGTHGTTEWLPGKAVALSPACWPRLVTGGLPVIYPYVVDDPGEAAPAKRRLSALTLGHLPPKLADVEASGEVGAAARPRRGVLAGAGARSAPGRDRRARNPRPRRGERAGAGLRRHAPISTWRRALTRLDAHLCDIAELPFRDGLHVFGQAAHEPVSAAGRARQPAAGRWTGASCRPAPPARRIAAGRTCCRPGEISRRSIRARSRRGRRRGSGRWRQRPWSRAISRIMATIRAGS